jgi:hypothetical protein
MKGTLSGKCLEVVEYYSHVLRQYRSSQADFPNHREGDLWNWSISFCSGLCLDDLAVDVLRSLDLAVQRRNHFRESRVGFVFASRWSSSNDKQDVRSSYEGVLLTSCSFPPDNPYLRTRSSGKTRMVSNRLAKRNAIVAAIDRLLRPFFYLKDGDAVGVRVARRLGKAQDSLSHPFTVGILRLNVRFGSLLTLKRLRVWPKSETTIWNLI